MPKIIDNARQQLIAQAKKQISENGYSKTTIRSVAKECNIAVGTVYNYFPSKDMLVAAFVLEDWLECTEKIKCLIKADSSPREALNIIYNMLLEFIDENKALFSDSDAFQTYAKSAGSRHSTLRNQVAQLIERSVDFSLTENSQFVSQFVAESLLTWTMNGESFENIYSVLKKII